MADLVNRKCVLIERPNGRPEPSQFEIVEEPLGPPPEGAARIAVEHLSIDPFIRAALNPGSAHPPVTLGAMLPALGVGRVIESNCEGLKAGDSVCGTVMAQTHATLPAMMVDVVDDSDVPLRTYLGVLGSTAGLTAYFGILDVGAVKEGDVVLMSAAAGAVGSIAGQIAKIKGAHVIGIAGGPEKVRFVCDELGFDACIDYKSEDVAARLGELAPQGVDLYFDNVGGEILDIALDHIANEGRVALCGAMTQYDHIDEGIEHLPQTLLRLFDGSHIGKLMLKVG